MLVNENVLIESPYLVEDCRLLEKGDGKGAAPGSVEQGSLLRIKKVLAMEREKLALRRGLGTGGLGGAMGKSRGGGARAGLGLGIGERKGG